MKYKTIIVEDEIMARKSLEKFCQNTEELELVQAFENAEDAKQFMDKEKIDLIFLDIEMPGMSGLELMDTMAYFPQVVFTTSNKEYAYDAFEYDITDFLAKPITSNRFQKAIEKINERHDSLNSIAIASKQNEIYIKSDKQFVRIPFAQILYFENVGDYIKVITELGNFVIHGSLKGLDQKIQHPRFIKVHRSYIVNLDRIVNIVDNSILLGKKIIPISRAHKPILMGALNIL